MPQAPIFSQRALPDQLEVVVEIARWGFVKRAASGRLDMVSLLPCPFNYGSVPDTVAADGDAQDVVLLGPRLPVGTRLFAPVLGRAAFMDAGLDDAKWICGQLPLARADRLRIELFFRLYARGKRGLNRLRGRAGITSYTGLVLRHG
jgi:inorganic pyrophosphatase